MSDLTLGPKFVRIEPVDVVGMARTYAPGAPNDIPELWQRFVARRGEIAHVIPGPCYGVCSCSKRMGSPGPEAFEYVAAVPVSHAAGVPEGMVSRHIPGGRYAAFTHRGPIWRLKETLDHITQTWLPQSGLVAARTPDFEYYDERFGDGGPASELDVYVPLERHD